MKFTRLFVYPTFILICAHSFAQTKQDTLNKAFTDSIQSVSSRTLNIQTDLKAVKTNIGTLKTNLSKNTSNSCGCKDLELMDWLLVFSPILVFALTLLVIGKRLKDFNLKDALTESDLPKKTIVNPLFTTENLTAFASNAAAIAMITPTIEVTSENDPPKSSSRYIAFITSALTWVCALCLTCFFIYQYLHTNQPPTLSGLSDVLIALGIGVVPYAFNKISSAIK